MAIVSKAQHAAIMQHVQNALAQHIAIMHPPGGIGGPMPGGGGPMPAFAPGGGPPRPMMPPPGPGMGPGGPMPMIPPQLRR